MAQKQKTEKELVVSGAGAAAAPRRKSAAPRTKSTTPRATHAAAQPETQSTAPVASPTQSEPTYEEIATLAYSFWEGRGCQGGCPEEDWLLAEQQLRTRS